MSTFKTLESGKIILELGRRSRNIEMRVAYSGFQGWSHWQWVAADALVILNSIFAEEISIF